MNNMYASNFIRFNLQTDIAVSCLCETEGNSE